MKKALALLAVACAHGPSGHPEPIARGEHPADEGCLPDGKYGADGSLHWSAKAPDEKSLSYCLVDPNDAKQRDCMRFDLETGTFHKLGDLKEGASGPEFYPPVEDTGPTTTVDAGDSKVTVCQHGTKDCKSIPFDPPIPTENTSASIDGDGKILAVVFNAESGSVVQTYDVATAKLLATVKADEQNPCVDAEMLGETLFFNANVCAGPGAKATFYDPRTGKAIASVPDANTYGAMPQHLDGNRWAIDDMGGKHVYVVDVTTGKVEKTIALPPAGTDSDNVIMDIGADDTLMLVYDTGAINVVDVKKGSASLLRPHPCK